MQLPIIKPVDILNNNSVIKSCITKIEHIPAKQAVWADFPDNLNPKLIEALKKHGFNKLYSHQRKAWDEIDKGNDIVIVTPTASGKTLCYNLPVLNCLLNDPLARALYLFPTKALSQDQQSELNEILNVGELDLAVNTFDGDTPQSVRKSAKEKSRIVISNPDMLHAGILPNHTKWINFFSNLKFIIVDEMHIYRGVFGSHVSNVLWRLLRIAAYYGSKPKFIFCSATIGNPKWLASNLIKKDVIEITENGAPSSEKTIVFYNPPLVDYVQGIRRSSADSSSDVAFYLLKNGVRTILFARSRIKVELLASYLNKKFFNTFNENNRIKVEPYRSGLLPLERRSIEKGLRNGEIDGVVSTNALELGIDIGGLDAAVISGWPGNMASFWQQSGRAGRRSGASTVVFVASSSALDQYYINHPEKIMSKASDNAHIDPENPFIFTDHIKCATFELPFSDNDDISENEKDVLNYLEEDGSVRHLNDKYYWSGMGYPAEKISLRSATAENVIIINTTKGKNEVLGEMDRPSAKELIFDNAIYIHLGRQFIVKKLDIENHQCLVEEKNVNYYTDGLVKYDIKLLSNDEERDLKNLSTVIGDLLVRSSAEKYKKLKFGTNENIGYGEIYLPPEELQTRTIILLFKQETESGKFLSSFSELKRAAILSSLSHIIKDIAPVFVLCEKSDIGTTWRNRDENFGVPAIYIWDKYPGGTGLSENLASMLHNILKESLTVVSSCLCEDGCPSCIGVPEEIFSIVNERKKDTISLLKLCTDN